MMKTNLFEFLLPRAWRRRREPDPERNDQVLARVRDDDPLFRALMDHAHTQFERTVVAAMEPMLTNEQRAHLCGQSFALYAFLSGVTSIRDVLAENLARATAEAKRKEELRQKRRASMTSPESST